jgi:hypothetical protein
MIQQPKGVAKMNKRFFITTFAALAIHSAAGGIAAAAESIDAADFGLTIDNPWHPLIPGTVMSYEGTKDDKPATQVVTVTSKTKTINGVKCIVVEDIMSLAGKAADKTTGYYAQDKDGNVWYFGEDVQELDAKGNVTKTEGWHAGIDGATPSIVMEATPAKGHSWINAYTNDHAEVVSVAKAVKVPFGSYKDALLVKEWTPDEPDVLTNKYYVKDVGAVRDVAVKGDSEEFLLVDVKR